MSKKTGLDDPELYRQAIEFQRIGNTAIQNAQAENRRRGIPNVYSRDGKVYFELPNGDITEENPFKDDA